MSSLVPDLHTVFTSLQREDVIRTLYGEATLLGLWAVWVITLEPFDISTTYGVLDRMFAGEIGTGLLMLGIVVASGAALRLFSRHLWIGGALLASGWAIICVGMASASPTSTASLMYGAHALACAWYSYRVAQLME